MAAAEALVRTPQPSVPPTLEPRPYQAAIAAAAADRNTLVVLPTGLGKTLIAALVARPHVARGERVLVLAPTRPLVDQHARSFAEFLPGVDVVGVTGHAPPARRADLWASGHVLIATPQTVRNDLLAGRLPERIALLVVDEAHRAVGNHAAADVAARLADAGATILALTASPGGDPQRVKALLHTLRIQHVEARTLGDPDVAPYAPGLRIDWVRVPLPPGLRAASARLHAAAERRIQALASVGLYADRIPTRRGLLKARERIDARLRAGALDEGMRRAIAAQAQGMRLLHALHLLESQGPRMFLSYAERLPNEDADLARDHAFGEAVRIVRANTAEHPKLRRLAIEVRRHLAREPGSRVLVFAQYRETVHLLADVLGQMEGVKARAFVGQARGAGDGMPQREQREVVEAFRRGDLNVLVATSVAEEGLDIPSVDLVVFYEPAPSEIRAIQRRGRTGRHRIGRVVVLIAKDTADEASYWSSVHKEREMRHVVDALKRVTTDPPPPAPASKQPALGPAGPTVIVDHRELNGPVARLLRSRGVEVAPGTLAVADFAVSDRVVVERKTAADFVASILDGRLFDQARALRAVAAAPLLLIEGNPWTARPGVKHAAVAGALVALAADFGLAVLHTDTPTETADVLAAMAKREAESGRGPPRARHDRPGKTLEEQQRFVVEGLPMVSATLADRLLAAFGSARAVLAAPPELLATIDGVGPKRAEAMSEVLDAPYAGGPGEPQGG